jgi:hypothetical protein
VNRALGLLLCSSLGACAHASIDPRVCPSQRVDSTHDVAPDPEAKREFESLKSLVGDWEATTAKGTKVRASYRLMSADSVLVETFTTFSGKQTLTLFHMDGPHVIATHYCAQGNQPRLRLRSTQSKTRFELSFFDITNLTDPQASHLRRLEIELRDLNRFDKTEEYVENDQPDITLFAFSRMPAAAP